MSGTASFSIGPIQACPRRRLVRRRLVSGDGAHVSATFSRPERGRTQMSQTRRRTNVQQLTCNIDLSCSFYYLFFSFVLLELKPFVLKGKVLGENYENV